MTTAPKRRLGTRFALKISSSPWFLRTIAPQMPKLDRAVHKLTGGRYFPSQGANPAVMLTTTGAKSGLPRTTPLASVPLDGDFFVVGSNYGGEKHPAWSANLIANPDARISFRGKDIEVRAHLLTAEEKVVTWPRLIERWPAYDRYSELTDRDLRVFRLSPK
ncbi:MAG TPA: nitroreductase family deazaflavin-dependent oxidoreductase [Mycobacteriales bacterium]|nr:nitroreductase family deazaflavin-dependent oxidoreductase [Mycobacteriales bacterium]